MRPAYSVTPFIPDCPRNSPSRCRRRTHSAKHHHVNCADAKRRDIPRRLTSNRWRALVGLAVVEWRLWRLVGWVHQRALSGLMKTAAKEVQLWEAGSCLQAATRTSAAGLSPGSLRGASVTLSQL